MVVSSANSIILLYKGNRCISFTNIINNSGPRQLPCAAPQVMLKASDFVILFGQVVIFVTKLFPVGSLQSNLLQLRECHNDPIFVIRYYGQEYQMLLIDPDIHWLSVWTYF